MQLHRVRLTAGELQAIPTEERALLVAMAFAINEVNTLNKVLAISTHFQQEPKWVAHAQSAQAFILARVLFGKLNELWVIVQDGYLRSRLAVRYDSRLPESARTALGALKTYFGKKSLANSVRNSFAFHFSLEHAAVTIPPDLPPEDLAIYLHDAVGNSLYQFAEVIMNVALFEGIAPSDPEAAANRLFLELSSVVAAANDFGQGLIVELFAEHLGDERLKSAMDTVEVENVPSYEGLSLPFFIDMPPREEPHVA